MKPRALSLAPPPCRSLTFQVVLWHSLSLVAVKHNHCICLLAIFMCTRVYLTLTFCMSGAVLCNKFFQCFEFSTGNKLEKGATNEHGIVTQESTCLHTGIKPETCMCFSCVWTMFEITLYIYSVQRTYQLSCQLKPGCICLWVCAPKQAVHPSQAG